MAKFGHTETYQVINLYDSKRREHVKVRIDFDVDWAKLARLGGAKAWRNSTKKSTIKSGAIKMEAREWKG